MVRHLLFVYGTLKNGFAANHHLRNQRYLGIARTEPKYAMYGYNGYPALVDAKLSNTSELPEPTNRIYGELYEVDDQCIRQIDLYEGTDEGLFARLDVSLSEVTLAALPTDKDVWERLSKKTAHAYFFTKELHYRGNGDCGNLWTSK